jgi:hypothetical protein
MSRIMEIPRGGPVGSPLSLDMEPIYSGESRLEEIRMVSPETAPELMGYFNVACNTATKYLSWIEYEILQAEKHFELAKATVILDKSPEIFNKLKESGVKPNEDVRNALIARDEECQLYLDKLNQLKAVRMILDSKAKSFIRAHNAAKVIFERKSFVAASPNLGTSYNKMDGLAIGVSGEEY